MDGRGGGRKLGKYYPQKGHTASNVKQSSRNGIIIFSQKHMTIEQKKPTYYIT